MLVFLAIVYMLAYFIARKQRDLETELTQERQRIDEEKIDFLINVSHELRTPLTLVYAPLKRALQQTQPSDIRYSLLQTAFRQSGRMRNVINMVLDLEKMERKNMRLHLSPHPFNQWMKDSVRDFVSEGQERGVRVVLQADTRIEKVVFDLQKCEIVLHNLLINALKHSPKNTTITVRTILDPVADLVRVTVSDEGPGLQSVDEEQLFSRYYQGEKETTGTGLGLAYSKVLIELHGGVIGAYNNETKGATFYFILPLRQKDAQEEDTQEEDVMPQPSEPLLTEESGAEPLPVLTKEGSASILPYTLLVVDDEESITEFLHETLRDTFKEILVAKDGVEALGILRTDRPDVVICDVMMPRMDGYALCQAIKGDAKTDDIPVILLTSMSDEQHVLRGYQTGADAFLPKPFDIDTLQQIVLNLLHTRQHVQEKYASQGTVSKRGDS